ncbi:hypothetical protein GGI04_003956 [Coemansia thaxteri]|nr:hypothetical protein GGI04_003956 [Coemansia thaxteri]KAJ2468577.1 hypothetical protein GGI02_003661 [Coemansia sp. RSA 2322]
MVEGEERAYGDIQLDSFEHQVAGHGGVLRVKDSRMVAKPLIKREQAFYESSAMWPRFKAFLPVYYGTLEQVGSVVESDSGETAESGYICLENLVDGYENPCIVDIKIGTQLHDVDAPPEKVARMMKKAKATTVGTHGVRVCGMMVPGVSSPSRDWLAGLTADTIGDAFARFFSAAETAVSAEYRRFVIRQFILEVEDLAEVIRSVETRMYSSSLLFVYDASKAKYEQFIAESKGDPSSIDAREDCGGGDYDTSHEGSSNDDGCASDDDDDDDPSDGLLDMKAIDFAHSHWVPGQGPDERYLFGLGKLVSILRSLLSQ